MGVYLKSETALYHQIPNYQQVINSKRLAAEYLHKFDHALFSVEADLRRNIMNNASAVEFMCEFLANNEIPAVPTKWQLKVCGCPNRRLPTCIHKN